MAARKLKLKPKPLVGSSIRRGRDKDDALNLAAKEASCGGKEKSIDNLSTEIKFEASTSHCLNQSTSSVSNLENSSRLKEVEIKNSENENRTKSKLNDDIIQPCVSVLKLDSSSIGNDSELTTVKNQINSDKCLSKNSSALSEVLRKSSSQRVICDATDSNKLTRADIGITSIIENINTPTDDVGKKNSKDSPQTTNKHQVLGEAVENSVLNSEVPVIQDHKKLITDKAVNSAFNSKVSLLKDNEHLIADKDQVQQTTLPIRTESVIKCVQTEISKKQNPIAKEIAESFSSLETNDQDLTPLINRINDLGSESDNASDKKQELISKKENKPTEGRCDPDILRTKGKLQSPIKKVSFSPIKPSSKVLVPKPSPRLFDTAQRRISFQGSDSEEEAAATHKIFWGNTESKTKSTKDKFKTTSRKRSQGSTYSKLGQDTLDKFSKKFGKSENPDKTKLTMLDLIFYNPRSNPMSQNVQYNGVKKTDLKANMLVEETLEEEKVDDLEPAPMPVPQLKVGPDGQVILDPQSLLIERTGAEQGRAKLENSEVVEETGITKYSTYSKKKPGRSDWTPQETLQFFRALNTIGSDFSLMVKLFPKRTRHELKLKFKKEERINLPLVDKAMTSPSDFDFETLQNEIRLENEEIMKKDLEAKMAAEIAKSKRLLKREENKTKQKTKPVLRRGSALKDFDENELGKFHSQDKPKHNARKKRKKSLSKKKTDEVDSDEQHDVEMDFESDSSLNERLSVLRTVKRTRLGRLPKVPAKLTEYEEINETLKRKLEQELDSDSEGYLPNGSDSTVLFGPPLVGPNTQEPEEEVWNVPSVPRIEDTVLVDGNVEEVSEISELGSFGQNDSVLELSIPVRGERQSDCSLLSRQIAESFQIIDQLTSNVESGESGTYCGTDVVSNVVEVQSETERTEKNLTLLPGFESVRSSCAPILYSFGTSYVSNVIESSPQYVTLQSNPAPSEVLESHTDDFDESKHVLGE